MARLPSSPHFILHELGEGIYAAIHAPGGWAQSNAGIIDLGDRTLIFDAFISPRATTDLLAAARTLTGRPAQMVMLSHFHNDHIWGSLAVPREIDILSTIKTRDSIALRDSKEDAFYKKEAAQNLAKMRVQLKRANTEREKAHAQYFVIYYEAIIDTLPLLPARVPNLVIQDLLEIAGSKRRARFFARTGHTTSDAILHLPDDKVLFLSDLFFVQAHPYLGDGNPEVLLQTMAYVNELGAEIMVPGHGPPGQKEDMDAMIGYIQELQDLVLQGINDGISQANLAAGAIPAKYSHWIYPNFYQENIQFLVQFHTTM
jgi:cyclase